MQNTRVILGMGGTIAGTSAVVEDNVGYSAAQLGVPALLAAVPGLRGLALEAEQVAQVDSKDMDFALWQRLAQRVAHHLERDDVQGIVVTHGTDTLEETAYFLQRVLAPTKPVVLTAAMRPATSLQADGPQNLLDAVTLAGEVGARGVLAVIAGAAYSPFDLRKLHSYRIDAFSSGDAGPVALVREGRVQTLRPWPGGAAAGLGTVATDVAGWPRVDVVSSYAGMTPPSLDALLQADGVVVAGTGNGTLQQALEAVLLQAQSRGLRVLRSTRCAVGGVIDPWVENGPQALASAGPLTPWQARIELLLDLLGRRPLA